MEEVEGVRLSYLAAGEVAEHQPYLVEVVVGEVRLQEAGEEVVEQNLTLEEVVEVEDRHQEAGEVVDRLLEAEEEVVRRSSVERRHFADFLSFVFYIRL